MNVIKMKRMNTRMTFGLKVVKVTSRILLYSLGRDGIADRMRSLGSTIVCVPGRIICGTSSCTKLGGYSIVIGTINSVALYTSNDHSKRLRGDIGRITSCIPGIVTTKFRKLFMDVAGPYSIITGLVTHGDNLPGKRIVNAKALLSSSHLVRTVSRRANLSSHNFATFVLKRRKGSRVIP